jgi:hypothetical protein
MRQPLACLLLLVGVLVSTQVSAQEFPSKPVHIMVGAAPGGLIDLFARTYGTKLQERSGQPVLVENNSVATGTIGTYRAPRARTTPKQRDPNVRIGSLGRIARNVRFAAFWRSPPVSHHRTSERQAGAKAHSLGVHRLGMRARTPLAFPLPRMAAR